MPGGKGNNVARVLRGLGHDVTATGFLGGNPGEFIEAGLLDAGVTPCFVWLKGQESRTCHTVLDEATGTPTEILESGPEVTVDEREELLRRLPAMARDADVAVISGSAPGGTPAAFLERMAGIVREHAHRMVVDSSGATLAALMTGRPDLIKPNETELEALMGRPAPERDRIAFARDELIARRMAPDACVLISMGADGAALVTRTETWRARPPSIRPVNTVGSGDAMLAGFIHGWLAGADPAAALRQAVAFGSAAALQPVAGVIEQDDVERLRPGVDLSGDVRTPE
jgi:tagatose 6-phosphate kinase